MTTRHDKAKRWRPWQFSLRMLLLLMLVVAAVIVLFGPHPFRSGDTIHIRFPGTVDIDQNCEIRYRGILVGKSRNIERLVDGNYLVTANLREGYSVRQDELLAYIPKTQESLGFIAVIISNNPSDWSNRDKYKDGAMIEGRVLDGPDAEIIRTGGVLPFPDRSSSGNTQSQTIHRRTCLTVETRWPDFDSLH